MDFHIDCTCGHRITVTEGSAGVTFPCKCGKPIEVPSLEKLRVKAGLPASAASPEMLLASAQANGELPPDWGCVVCNSDTKDFVRVVVECELALRTGGFSWAAAILSVLFLPITIFHREPVVQYGADKIYQLPLPACRSCQPALRDAATIKNALRIYEIYDRLLEKFPDARVRLA